MTTGSVQQSLTFYCQDFFYERDIRRGRLLFESGGVQLKGIGEGGARGLVRGRSQPAYEVVLSFAKLRTHETMGVACECANAEAGNLCKHLWAMIEECSRYDLLTDPLDDFFIVDCDPRTVQIGLPQSSNSSGTSASTGMRRWRQQLLAVSSLASGQDVDPIVPGPPEWNVAHRATQHWFIVSLDAALNEGPLVVKIYRSTKKKAGGWSKLQVVSVSPQDVQKWSDPVEQAALRMLDPQSSSYSQHYYSQFNSTSEFTVGAEVSALTLRALAATGRFAWSLAAERSVLDPQPLRFYEGAPVRMHVRIAEHVNEAGKTKLMVEPTLRNAEQVIPIADVLAIIEGGIVLRQQDVLLMPAHQVALARSWQKIGKIEVPRRSLITVLDEAAKWHGVDLEIDPELPIEQAITKPRPRLHLSSPDRNGSELLAAVRMVYGENDIEVISPVTMFWNRDEKSIGHRDFETEQQWMQSLPCDDFKPDSFGQLRLHRKLLPKMVSELTAAGWEVVADGNVMRRAGSFNIAVESGQDWFDLNASADFDGVLASLPELLAALRKGQDFIVLDDGSHGMLPSEWLQQFAGFDRTGKVEEDSIRFTKTQALLLDALLSEQENVSLDRAFRAWCEKLNSFSGITAADAPEGFSGQLRDYQRLGLGWFRFLQEFRLGGCLADDMGLGKTIQVLALLEQRRAETPEEGLRRKSLIVVPKSLIFNWLEEAAKFAPKLKVLNYTGGQRVESQTAFDDCDAVVTTYGTMRNDIEFLRKQTFDYAILDEAQAIKNPASLAAKASRLLQSEHRLAMTGTPVENHLGDLWSLFDFLNPGMLGQAIGTPSGATAENGDRLQQISQSLRPFILRRTKSQVLTELPEKTEQTLYCEMSNRQRKLYDDLRDHYRAMLLKKIDTDGLAKSKIVVLEALLRLRQAACDPRLVDAKSKVHGAKIDRLVEQIEEVVGEGHKALVFSQFTSLLSLVRKELDKRNWTYAYLDGKTTKRQQHVERFQNDPDCPLFLISLKAGGHGLNLTAADYVFIMDPWWNPAVEAQAIDRAHRMGQTQCVVAYRMICRDTVEEKIVDLQTSKRKLADAIISQEKSLVGELTSEDLRMLFS